MPKAAPISKTVVPMERSRDLDVPCVSLSSSEVFWHTAGCYGRGRIEGEWWLKMPMETAEILHEFERATGKFARAAVEAAVARREEITPELLRILEETVERAAQLDAEGDYMAYLYAMFLLAQFRETRAYSLWCALRRFRATSCTLCGDFITEDLGRVLASVCGGELPGIQSLIENEATDE
jgi:hypothetical protein